MVEVSLAVCGHYSYTKYFEISMRKRERVGSAKDREREGSGFSESEVSEEKCNFPEAFTIYL